MNGTSAPEATDVSHRFIGLQERLLAQHAPSFRSRRLDLGAAGAAHVLEGGQGPPLLMVHGGGGVAALWMPILERMAEDFHVVAVDRPGCGLSAPVDYRAIDDYGRHGARFLAALLECLDWRRAHIMANSMGGYWALELALAEPARLDHLVLAGAPAGVDRGIPLGMRLLGVPGLGRLMMKQVRSPKGIRDMYGRILVADVQHVSPDLLELSRLAFQLPGAMTAWLTMLHAFLDLRGVRRPWYVRDAVERLVVPTLFLWGDQDAFAPPESGARLAARMPRARLERIPSAGHLPWLDRPDAVAGAALRWLRAADGDAPRQ